MDKIVNGLKVGQLFETIDAIKENKEIAKFKFKAQNKWIDGAENHTTVSDYSAACATRLVVRQPANPARRYSTGFAPLSFPKRTGGSSLTKVCGLLLVKVLHAPE